MEIQARAYEGEPEIWEALRNIVDKMPTFINPQWPRVPNPADPAEDYADKWSRDPRLEKCFREWHAAVRSDIAKLPTSIADGSVRSRAKAIFRIELTDKDLCRITTSSQGGATIVVKSAPAFYIPSAPRPWGH